MSVLNVEELKEIVEVVWMTMLELPVETGLSVEIDKNEYLTASVAISGAWQGSIHLKTTRDFLTRAASRVFMKNSEEIELQDRVDTVTELTNMIGGTIKSLLPETCDLSLPVLLTEHSAAAAADESGVNWVHFTSDGSPLAIAIVGNSADESVAA